jgi:hypothetical protein
MASFCTFKFYCHLLAVDNVEPEKYLAERPAAEPPDDTVLSTAYIIVFERTGDIRHFANDFPDGLQLPNLVIDGRVGCAWGAGARAARCLRFEDDIIVQTSRFADDLF